MSTKIQIAENQELVRYDNPGEWVHNELFKIAVNGLCIMKILWLL